MKRLLFLLKSKTVLGTILTVVGTLVGKESGVTPTDIMTGIGVIVGVAGARDAVAKKGALPE